MTNLPWSSGAHRVADHGQVLFGRRPQDFLDMQQPGLAKIVTTGVWASISTGPGRRFPRDLFAPVEPNAARRARLNFLRRASAKNSMSWD